MSTIKLSYVLALGVHCATLLQITELKFPAVFDTRIQFMADVTHSMTNMMSLCTMVTVRVTWVIAVIWSGERGILITACFEICTTKSFNF